MNFVFSNVYGQTLEQLPESFRKELERHDVSLEEFVSALNYYGIDTARVDFESESQLNQLLPILRGRTNPAYREEIEVPQDVFLDSMTVEPDSLVIEDDTLKTKSNIYGHDFFTESQWKVHESSEKQRVSESYVLGIGDELVLSIWGISNFEKSALISADGYLYLDGLNTRIYLEGLRLTDARKLVMSRLSNFLRFRKEEFHMSVKSSRIISVQILGEVQSPGIVRLPASNSLFQFIAAAGAPTHLATLRDIVVKNGDYLESIDMYELFQNPFYDKSVYIPDNATIYVRSMNKRVHIKGDVNRSLFYDLKEDDTLFDVIRYAGGLKASARKSRIEINRFLSDRVETLNYSYEESENVILHNGDVIKVNRISSRLQNYIRVEGAVRDTGTYEWSEKLFLSSVLNKAGLAQNAKRDVGLIERIKDDDLSSFISFSPEEILEGNSEDIQLKMADIIHIFELGGFVDSSTVKTAGALRSPQSISLSNRGSMTVKDLIVLSKGLISSADNYAFLFRKSKFSSAGFQYIPIYLGDAEYDFEDGRIQVLPGDSLYVYDLSETYSNAYVSILGEINRPDSIAYDPSLTIKSLIQLAAGFTAHAAKDRIEVYRVVVDADQASKVVVRSISLEESTEGIVDADFKILPYDQVVVRKLPDYELQKMVEIEGEIRYPGPYALLNDNQTISELVSMAGGLTAESFPPGASLYRQEKEIGYVVLKLDRAMDNPKSAFNYTLKNGDRIFIPKRTELVEISGAINAALEYPTRFINKGNSIKVPYHENKTVKYYLENYAAGIAENGDPRFITVEHPSGQIQTVKNFLFFKSYPVVKKGSKIKVGFKPAKEQVLKVKEKVHWGHVLAETITQATAVLSLLLLIQRI